MAPGDAKRRIVALLLDAGWQPAGETRLERVRLSTARSPVHGGIGGEAREFGGRARFELPGTDRRATVGARTVSFYRVTDGKAQDLRNYDTARDLDAIAAQAAAGAATPRP